MKTPEIRPANRFIPLLLLLLLAAVAAGLFAGTQPLQAQQPQALEALKERMRPVLELDGVVFTDADETTGRLVVGVESKGRAPAVEQRLAALGIPVALVDIRETPPIVFMDTLQDRARPLEGGVQIYFVRMPFAYVCTLGFNAVLDGVSGFITNSHCTAKQFEADGTQHFQPSGGSANLVGRETKDPPSFTGSGCPARRQCRWSDTAFSTLEAGVTANLGQVKHTSAPNDGSLEVTGSFTISGEASGNASIGTVLSKVGRTTGWTEGSVSGSCVDTNVSGTRFTLFCQDFVTASVAGGDSGSPVFARNADGTVTLYGILWGGASDGSMFVYSPMKNVRMPTEMGNNLTTHAGGSTPPPANQAPSASFTYSCAGLTCSFDGSASSDPDGSIASYAWAFGDGSTGSGAATSHTYAAAGTYTVTLTVTDNAGATNTTSQAVTVADSSATQMKVESVTYSTSGGPQGNRHLTVSIKVVNESGAPVSGAAVSFTLSHENGSSWNRSGTTNSSGVVSGTLNNAPGGCYTTTVNSVTLSGSIWDGQTPANQFCK